MWLQLPSQHPPPLQPCGTTGCPGPLCRLARGLGARNSSTYSRKIAPSIAPSNITRTVSNVPNLAASTIVCPFPHLESSASQMRLPPPKAHPWSVRILVLKPPRPKTIRWAGGGPSWISPIQRALPHFCQERPPLGLVLFSSGSCLGPVCPPHCRHAASEPEFFSGAGLCERRVFFQFIPLASQAPLR